MLKSINHHIYADQDSTHNQIKSIKFHFQQINLCPDIAKAFLWLNMGILRNKENQYEPIRIEECADEVLINEYDK